MRRLLSFIIVAVFVFNLTFSTLLSSAAEVSVLSAGSVSNAEPGEVYTISLVSDNEISTLNGVVFSVAYDTSRLQYVNNSLKSTVFKDFNVYFNTSRKQVSFAWDSLSAVKIPAGTSIAQIQLMVLDEAEAGDASVTFSVEPFLKITNFDTLTYGEIKVTPSVTANVSVVDTNTLVDSVMQKIKNIGTVTYSDASLNLITIAANAYADLSIKQKGLVTNYSVLVSAIETYQSLRAAAESGAVASEVAKYKADHAKVIELTVDTVTIADKAAVLEAQTAFNNLSTKAKSELSRMRGLCTVLLNKIADLEKSESQDTSSEAGTGDTDEDAKEFIEQFRKKYKSFYSLKESELIAEHIEGIGQALAELEEISLLSPTAYSQLSDDLAMFENFKTIVTLLQMGDKENVASSVLQADSFRTTFGWILALTEDTVIKDDAKDIEFALMVIDIFDEETQKLLEKEKEKLTALATAVGLLPEEDSAVDSDIESDVKVETTVIEKIKTEVINKAKDVVLTIKQRLMSNLVLYLGILFAISALLFCGSAVSYWLTRKKYNMVQFGEEMML